MRTRIFLNPSNNVLSGQYRPEAEHIHVILDSADGVFSVVMPDTAQNEHKEFIFYNIPRSGNGNSVTITSLPGQFLINSDTSHVINPGDTVSATSDNKTRWLLTDVNKVDPLAHARLHALNSTNDHSSEIPQNTAMIADANGLPKASAFIKESSNGIVVDAQSAIYPFEVKGYSNILTRYSNDANSSSFFVQKARGTSSSPLPIENADPLGGFTGKGYLNGAFRVLGNIKYVTTAAPSGNHQATEIQFWSDDGTVYALKCVIKPDGKIGIGTAAPKGIIDIQKDTSGNPLGGIRKSVGYQSHPNWTENLDDSDIELKGRGILNGLLFQILPSVAKPYCSWFGTLKIKAFSAALGTYDSVIYELWAGSCGNLRVQIIEEVWRQDDYEGNLVSASVDFNCDGTKSSQIVINNLSGNSIDMKYAFEDGQLFGG